MTEQFKICQVCGKKATTLNEIYLKACNECRDKIRKRTVIQARITVRFKDTDLAKIKHEAGKREMSANEFIRWCVNEQLPLEWVIPQMRMPVEKHEDGEIG